MPGAAFFDVDETLITIKSMFRFLEYYLAAPGQEGAYARAEQELRELAAAGVPREVTNRRYYSHFAGADARLVAARGESWFAGELRRGGLFHPPALAALRGHQGAGDLVFLVSGSFPGCLDPVARHVGADGLLCSMPVIDGGRYTGEVSQVMIGAAKGAAASQAMAGRGLLARNCAAYADHASDLSLLEAVGRPVVVGADPVLLRHARAGHWGRLPAAVPAVAGPGPEGDERWLPSGTPSAR
jgi:HAD superfamily hydrolase (TIGR01490 family)